MFIGPLGNKLQWNCNRNYAFSFKKMLLKMSSGKWRPSYLGLNVLTIHCSDVRCALWPLQRAIDVISVPVLMSCYVCCRWWWTLSSRPSRPFSTYCSCASCSGSSLASWESSYLVESTTSASPQMAKLQTAPKFPTRMRVTPSRIWITLGRIPGSILTTSPWHI